MEVLSTVLTEHQSSLTELTSLTELVSLTMMIILYLQKYWFAILKSTGAGDIRNL